MAFTLQTSKNMTSTLGVAHRKSNVSSNQHSPSAFSQRNSLCNCSASQHEDLLEDLITNLYIQQIKPLAYEVKRRLQKTEGSCGYLLKNYIAICAQAPHKFVLDDSDQNSAEGPAILLKKEPANFVCFIDPRDKSCPYPPRYFQHISSHLLHLARTQGVNACSFAGGRFMLAQHLQTHGPPELQVLTLGQLCHLIQLAVGLGVLGYENCCLKPMIACAQLCNAECSRIQFESALTSAQGGAAVPALDEDIHQELLQVKERMTTLLEKAGDAGICLSQLRQIYQQAYGETLPFQKFGHTKLIAFLNQTLKDVCIVESCGKFRCLVKLNKDGSTREVAEQSHQQPQLAISVTSSSSELSSSASSSSSSSSLSSSVEGLRKSSTRLSISPATFSVHQHSPVFVVAAAQATAAASDIVNNTDNSTSMNSNGVSKEEQAEEELNANRRRAVVRTLRAASLASDATLLLSPHVSSVKLAAVQSAAFSIAEAEAATMLLNNDMGVFSEDDNDSDLEDFSDHAMKRTDMTGSTRCRASFSAAETVASLSPTSREEDGKNLVLFFDPITMADWTPPSKEHNEEIMHDNDQEVRWNQVDWTMAAQQMRAAAERRDKLLKKEKVLMTPAMMRTSVPANMNLSRLDSAQNMLPPPASNLSSSSFAEKHMTSGRISEATDQHVNWNIKASPFIPTGAGSTIAGMVNINNSNDSLRRRMTVGNVVHGYTNTHNSLPPPPGLGNYAPSPGNNNSGPIMSWLVAANNNNYKGGLMAMRNY